MTVSSTMTTKEQEQQEKKVSVDFFHIDMIPDAMDKMGWKVAPKVMRHWFSIKPALAYNPKSKSHALDLDAYLLPESEVNTDIVKMSWAMQYKQVSEGVRELSKRWNSENGRALLTKRISRVADFKKATVRIGYTEDVKVLDATAQVNLQRVGSLFDTVDDWYGAMGNSNLKVCLRGHTLLKDNRHAFIVEKVGFYLKDTYDFLDENIYPEPLGIWSKDRALDKTDMALYLSSYNMGEIGRLARTFSGFVPVFNSDFRKWQEKHNSGGDFIIFSDVLWMNPETKDKVITL